MREHELFENKRGAMTIFHRYVLLSYLWNLLPWKIPRSSRGSTKPTVNTLGGNAAKKGIGEKGKRIKEKNKETKVVKYSS